MSIELRRLRVCAAGEIPPGEGRVVRIGDRPVAVFRSGDTFYALDNTCTHMGGSLADGLTGDETVACPLHERRFALATGAAVGHDCGAVAAYPVELRDDDVFLTVPVMRGAQGAAVTLGTFGDGDVRRSRDDAARAPGTADSHADVRAQAEADDQRSLTTSDGQENEVQREVEENADLVAHRRRRD